MSTLFSLIVALVFGLTGCSRLPDDAASNSAYTAGVGTVLGQLANASKSAEVIWHKASTNPNDPALASELHSLTDQWDMALAAFEGLKPTATFADFHQRFLANLQKVKANSEAGEKAVRDQRHGDIIRALNEFTSLSSESIALMEEFTQKNAELSSRND